MFCNRNKSQRFILFFRDATRRKTRRINNLVLYYWQVVFFVIIAVIISLYLKRIIMRYLCNNHNYYIVFEVISNVSLTDDLVRVSVHTLPIYQFIQVRSLKDRERLRYR